MPSAFWFTAFWPYEHCTAPLLTFGFDSAYTSKLRPPSVHEATAAVQLALAGTSHWVSQTMSVSVSGASGAAVLRFVTFIVTRRHAVPAGRQLAGRGLLTLDDRMSRFGIEAVDELLASNVPSPAASVVEPSGTCGPVTCFPWKTPGPPVCWTNIAC